MKIDTILGLIALGVTIASVCFYMGFLLGISVKEKEKH